MRLDPCGLGFETNLNPVGPIANVEVHQGDVTLGDSNFFHVEVGRVKGMRCG